MNTMNIGPVGLVLVDVQEDFFDRAGVTPDRSSMITRLTSLLQMFREVQAPVAHARTLIDADGTNAMPHWEGRTICVSGTPGAAPPPQLGDLADELVTQKQFYDAFADATLEPWLRAHGVRTIVIAGLYSHACVRETALSAYERGFSVVIARDAVATDSPAHERESLDWLSQRGIRVLDSGAVAQTLADGDGEDDSRDGNGTARVDEAAQTCAAAQVDWSRVPLATRRKVLDKWMHELERRKNTFVDALVADVLKPVALANDEVTRALGHIKSALSLSDDRLNGSAVAVGVTVEPRPLGVIGIIMPWNNPLALPVGKIAPALLTGNGIVFKPAPEGERVAHLLVDTLTKAGCPTDLVTVVTGGPSAGMRVVHSPFVDGIAVTGSIATGRTVGAACATLGKPVQAELGGNNAAIVLDDVDLTTTVSALVRNAFGYSGQRCTAVRRFVVLESIADEFIAAAVAETERLEIGGPADITTAVGPVISEKAALRILGSIAEAKRVGNAVLTGGSGFEALGLQFVRPTLIRADDASTRIVQHETFGPVAVVQVARDIDHAVELANGVAQGLILSICTNDENTLSYIAERAEVGIVSVGPRPVPVHPDAPFGGWKASGIGTPEHGVWDLQFFTRPQARYRP